MFNLWKLLAKETLGPDAAVWNLIIDFEDAFMSTGTLPEEQNYTAAQVEDPSSPTGTYVYVWHTLGFGGKPSPSFTPGRHPSRPDQPKQCWTESGPYSSCT